jgi:hypothetical protein
MKKIIVIVISLLFSINIFSQEKMYIHKSDFITLGTLVSSTDSIYFNNDKSIIYFQIADSLAQFPLSKIDSLSFGPNSDTVYIFYNDNWISYINPLAFEGVKVDINGADVIVTNSSQIRDVNYIISGYSIDGSLKIYSEKRFNLILNNINLTNQDGPAINNQSNSKMTVIINTGTNNSLSDGLEYSSAPMNDMGEEEDQKSTLFSEGEIDFKGNGYLTIDTKATDKHSIASDEDIQIEEGNITIPNSSKDGIHGKEGFSMLNGNLNITSSSDGIDGDEGYIDISGGTININCSSIDAKAIKCDSTLTISGGSINISTSGNQSKGLKSVMDMTLSAGTININTSGGVVLKSEGSGFNPSYCSAIKCESNINISGADITILSTGIAGKGISGDKDLTMTSGRLNITTRGDGATYKNSTGTTDAYQGTCISLDGAINLLGGSVTTNSSGKGSQGINGDATLNIGTASSNPNLNITTTGTSIVISTSGSGPNKKTIAAEAKAIKCDGAVTINNGNVTISSADDGIKSTSSITINNGTISITKSIEGMESPSITVNDGNVSIVSSDDGFNSTKGNGGEADDNSELNINGGYIVLNSSNGDPLDSNGDLTMKGGTVIVHGPQSSPEVGMDVNGTTNVSGGFLVVSGTNSNMTEAPSSSSSQYSVMIKSQQSISSSTLFHIQDASGNELITFKPVRNYYSIVFSSSELKNGSTYSIYTGGTHSGTVKDGLYTAGTYLGGTLKKTFMINQKVMTVTM